MYYFFSLFSIVFIRGPNVKQFFDTLSTAAKYLNLNFRMNFLLDIAITLRNVCSLFIQSTP